MFGDVNKFMRAKLEAMRVGDEIRLPLHQRSTYGQQSIDLSRFHGIWFKTKVDQDRKEIVVRRIK